MCLSAKQLSIIPADCHKSNTQIPVLSQVPIQKWTACVNLWPPCVDYYFSVSENNTFWLVSIENFVLWPSLFPSGNIPNLFIHLVSTPSSLHARCSRRTRRTYLLCVTHIHYRKQKQFFDIWRECGDCIVWFDIRRNLYSSLGAPAMPVWWWEGGQLLIDFSFYFFFLIFVKHESIFFQ